MRVLSVNSRRLLPKATKNAPATGVKFSAVTGASWSPSLPQAGFPSLACGARADLGHYSDTRRDLSQDERANTWTFQRARPDSNGGPAGSKPDALSS